MRRAALALLVALAIAPAVFATSAAPEPVALSARPTGDHVSPAFAAAIDGFCARRDSRICDAWRDEARLDHRLRVVEGEARVTLRRAALEARVRWAPSAGGATIEAVAGARMVRCGTPAFAAIAAAVRASGPPDWIARIDGCQPDAREPVEIERRALRPIIVGGAAPVARLRHGDRELPLRWTAAGWRPTQ